MLGLEIVLAVVTVAALIVFVDAYMSNKRKWGENK